MAKTAVFLIQEENDKFGLRAVFCHTIAYSREIDVLSILVNQENMEEFLGILRVV